MFTAPILAAMLGIIGYHLGKKNVFIGKWFGGFIGILLGITLGLLAALIIGSQMPTEEHMDRTELRSLSNSTSISGKFFLGSGRINEEMHYHFFYSDDGGFRYDNISAEDDVIIFEEDRDDAHLLERKEECVNKYSWFGLCTAGSDTSYEFHIPEGSVLEEYSLQ